MCVVLTKRCMNPLYILCSEYSTCMHKEKPRPIESLLWADDLNFEKNLSILKE